MYARLNAEQVFTSYHHKVCTAPHGCIIFDNICYGNQPVVKTRANHDKKSSKLTKKITRTDDMMIHNFVKYLIQTQFRL